MAGILTDIALFFIFKTLDFTIGLLIVVLIFVLQKASERP